MTVRQTVLGTMVHVTGATAPNPVVIASGEELDAYLRSNFSVRLPTPDLETDEILDDPELAASIDRALEQARAGEGRPWREIFAELD